MAAVIALMILTATKGDPGAQISGWADTSLIWLILPVLLVAILVAVLLFALVYLLARALKILPVYTGIAQQYAGLAADKIKYLSNRLVAPIISIKSSMAGVNKVVEKLVGHNKGVKHQKSIPNDLRRFCFPGSITQKNKNKEIIK